MAESNSARYALSADGAIANWLALGPLTAPLRRLDKIIAPTGAPLTREGRGWIANAPTSLHLKLKVYESRPGAKSKPGAAPCLHQAAAGKRWEYARAAEDALIDFSRFNFSPTRMEAWTFACLQATDPQALAAELLTLGPTRVWVNGKLQGRYIGFGYVEPIVVPLTLALARGRNEIFLHGEMIGWREARLALGLRLLGKPAVIVEIPLGTVSAHAWHRAEENLARIIVKQFAFPLLPARLALEANTPAPLAVRAQVSIPLPTHLPTVFQAEAEDSPVLAESPLALPVERASLCLAPGESAELPITPAIGAGLARLNNEFNARLNLEPTDGTPLMMTREVWTSTRDFRTTPYADYDTRRREALERLAEMRADVLGGLAAVAIGQARTMDTDAITLAIEFMRQRFDCADFYALSLLALLAQLENHPALPATDVRRIAHAFRHFKFWIDEPGVDAMCYFTENHQILFHVTAYLAGQRWRTVRFSNSGLTGAQLQARARPRIEQWIRARLRGGFSEWDSNAYLALDAYALLALVEFAASARLREMATTLLHKIFFILACQSFRGAHGSTHGRCYVPALKSARVEGSSGMQRIAWGLGIFNGESRATGMLALARNYRVPEILQNIGADLPDVLTTRAQSAGRYRPQFDLRRGDWNVNTLTRRTPDYMLSAAMDQRPGAVGIQEHLWQATLSPEAVVFTTHPGNSQEHGNARPNFWAGSARLPRVAMVDRSVICVYNLVLDGGLGFTHAYFPTAAFDEWTLAEQWAFARVGNGYVALWGDGTLQLTPRGQHAFQEIRSRGRSEIWVCHMGSAKEDGDFASFVRAVTAHPPRVDALNVTAVTPDGRALHWGWRGACVADGKRQPLAFPHYDNAYTRTPLGADTMTIRYDRTKLVLDLEHGRPGDH